jgi:hypothetical protein
MANEQIKEKAQQSIEESLAGGQSVTQGDMQVSRVSVRDAFEISNSSEDIAARKAGRRPLFRSFNLSGIS